MPSITNILSTLHNSNTLAKVYWSKIHYISTIQYLNSINTLITMYLFTCHCQVKSKHNSGYNNLEIITFPFIHNSTLVTLCWSILYVCRYLLFRNCYEILKIELLHLYIVMNTARSTMCYDFINALSMKTNCVSLQVLT